MSFLYPREISITRPDPQNAVGQGSYGGLSPVQETPVVSGVAASIQFAKATRNNVAGLPGDVPISDYKVFARGIGLGIVQDRDVVTDDLGNRYQVVAAYWDSLGVNLYCQMLEA